MILYCSKCRKLYNGSYENCPECHGILTIKLAPWTKIKKEEFLKYEEARKSGLWNMVTDIDDIIKYTGLSRDTYLIILKYYSELKSLYGGDN